jgi:hypothetical protein
MLLLYIVCLWCVHDLCIVKYYSTLDIYDMYAMLNIFFSLPGYRTVRTHISTVPYELQLVPLLHPSKEPIAIHGAFGLTFHPLQKANTIADCLENHFTPHDLCDETHKRQMEARVQTLLKAVDNNFLKRIRPWDLQKLVNCLTLKKARGTDDIPNECLRYLPRRTLVHLSHPINHCLRLSHFPMPWKDAKIITLLKPGKDSKSLQNK